MSNQLKLPVMEIFGPTIQGEGKLIGQKTMFIRTAGCDYKCKWCDSAFTWDGSEKPTLFANDAIIDTLQRLGGDRFQAVTISGGNPALYNEAMAELIAKLQEQAYFVSLETQGSIWQPWLVKLDEVTISPKPPSSGMNPDLHVLDDIIHQLREAGTPFNIKIVIFDKNDLTYAKAIFNRYRAYTNELYLSVGNPDPRSASNVAAVLLEKLDELFNWVIQDPELNDVKPLPQLHTLVWNNKRGV